MTRIFFLFHCLFGIFLYGHQTRYVSLYIVGASSSPELRPDLVQMKTMETSSLLILLCITAISIAVAFRLAEAQQADTSGKTICKPRPVQRSSPRTLTVKIACIFNCVCPNRHIIPCIFFSGFISIDCGLSGKIGYVDDTTKISYAPDAAFTDSGVNNNIASEYMTPFLVRQYRTLRSFPEGVRNCYTVQPIVRGSTYLLRASFLYGNYDGRNKPPVFDLHFGVNLWKKVNVSDPNETLLIEGIVLVPDDFVEVCLVNTGNGTPFISVLDLRPMKSSLYPVVNATLGINLLDRISFGSSTHNLFMYDQTVYASSISRSTGSSAVPIR